MSDFAWTVVAALGWIAAGGWWWQARRWREIAEQEQALAHRYAETLQRSINLTDEVLAFNDALTQPARGLPLEPPYSGPVQ